MPSSPLSFWLSIDGISLWQERMWRSRFDFTLNPLLHCGQTNDFSAETDYVRMLIIQWTLHLSAKQSLLTIVCSLMDEHACIGWIHFLTNAACPFAVRVLFRCRRWFSIAVVARSAVFHVDGVLWVHAARAKKFHSLAREREEKSIFES